ncbi:hypothetical protein AGR7C_Lc220130 [Agrobacterium deltaense Zutra 3/1]|uniref:Uncharacterized protein n=1 Tax=Agrobacterium deltaense Zutra 3/1 TaxID=1183427 RepID=A0A1S7RT58_9HYPH|nr:hypothetical protein AGR7C_Lc220130 [Agrobacterium deltaense Zutra 3/1]
MALCWLMASRYSAYLALKITIPPFGKTLFQ